jgi:hypothetical protein
MRRINQIISGHNYYRKANEILYTDSQTGSLGVFDELKQMPDGVKLCPSKFKPLAPYAATDAILESKSGGVCFMAPTVTDYTLRAYASNVMLEGDFELTWEGYLISKPAGYFWTDPIRLCFLTRNKTAGYHVRFGGTVDNTAGEDWISSFNCYLQSAGADGDNDYKNIGAMMTPYKFKVVRSGMQYYFYGWNGSSWVWIKYYDGILNPSTPFAQIGVTVKNKSTTDYISVALKNLTLVKGVSHILW